MRKRNGLCLVISIVLLLSACSAGVPDGGSHADRTKVNNAVWSSEGGVYRQSGVNLPGCCVSVFANDKSFYLLTVFPDYEANTNRFEILRDGTDTIYSLEDGSIDWAAESGEGIWLSETVVNADGIDERLRLISYSGDVLKDISLNSIGQFDNPVFAICCAEGKLYLKDPERIAAVDLEGNLLGEIKLGNGSSVLTLGNDKRAYLVYYTGESIEVNLIDDTDLKPVFTLAEPEGRLYGGGVSAYRFILSTPEGLYGINEDGSRETILIWSDCGIAMTRTIGVLPLTEGRFMLLDVAGTSILTPAEPSDMREKTTLILATAGSADMVRFQAMNYNMSSSDYYIEVKDYSEGGACDRDTAVKKLNTELITGKYPDMLMFTDISPFVYISRGYCADMGALMDRDPDISREDIVIEKQLTVDDGIYFIDGQFNINTMVGLYSDFGDTFGWTLDEYLEVEKNAPAKMKLMYNTTKRYFLRAVSSLYLRSAIDWEAKTCDFDNEDFIAILNASNRIKENPEPETMAELDLTPHDVRLNERTLYTAAQWIGDVWSLADRERSVGQSLSVVGIPTVDGSCGMDIYLNLPIGICSESENINGCWSFIKYILTSVDPNAEGTLPVYMPYLQNQIEHSLNAGADDKIKMTQEDVDRFMALLSAIKGVTLYDETVLSIIDNEAAAFFDGTRTAEETAKTIQSRVSIYVAEQG